MDNLEKSILKTISYYDVFDYPLTAVEIWQWLWQYKCKLSKLVFCLENSNELKNYLEVKDGFYFFKGRSSLLLTRKIRRDYSINKWKKALRATRIIRFIPFLRAIFLCNSIPYFNAEKNSDIDFFIIIKDKYIWLSRFWITILLHILGLRRHGQKIANRICLSFYITDKSLNLKDFYDQDNLYLYAWIKDLSPIFDKNTYHSFLKANDWIKKYLPNSIPEEIIDNWKVKDNKLSIIVRRVQEFILDNVFGRFLNFIVKELQLARMSLNKKSKMKEESDAVVVNDQMLKFHEAGLEKINIILSKMKSF